MRLANNFGSVYELKGGNRRRPFVAKKTIGYNDKKQALYKVIGYYETKEKALIGLSEYNNRPYNIELKNITFTQLYEMWLSKKRRKIENETLKESSLKSYKSIYKNHCSDLYNKCFIDIKTNDIQRIIDNCNGGYSLKCYIKGLFFQMYEYAMQIDLPINRNYARYIELGKQVKSTMHINMSENDINCLWEHVEEKNVDLILILIYTGLRPQELLNIETKNIFIDNRYMVGGMKTTAGTNRIIPLHDRIIPLIEKRLLNAKKYLITSEIGNKYSYAAFQKHWNKAMNKLNLEYLPYDARHTAITRLNNVNANYHCVKLIVGHKLNDITSIYTHKDKLQLIETINLLA